MNPALKKIFCLPITIQHSIEAVAPDIAQMIDFSTLEALGPELVGDELARRFPEMLWIARTRGSDAQVVFLLYLEAENDQLMSVRVAFDSHQAVRELHQRMRPPPDLASLHVVPVVIHGGRDRWNAPGSLEELFSRGEAGDQGDARAKSWKSVDKAPRAP